MSLILYIFILITTMVMLCEAGKCKQFSESEMDVEFEEISKKNVNEFKNVEARTKKAKTNSQRKSMFKQKMQQVNKHNAGNPSFCQGPNKFTSMDHEEFASAYLGIIPSNVTEKIAKRSIRPRRKRAVPTAVDHSDKTGPVESQGSCGSCWSFSASHSITGTLVALKNFPITSFSKQQLVECAKGKSTGCDGAYTYIAFQYLTGNNFKTESEHPYTARDGNPCPVVNTDNILLKGYGRINYRDVQRIKEQLVKQPMAVAMYSDTDSFRGYKSGVYVEMNNECPAGIDHDLTLVGYGYDAELSMNYWKIKNSWGTGWGEDGFVRVRMGYNDCSVESDIRYPIPSDTARPPETVPDQQQPDQEEPTECVNEAKDCAYYGSSTCVNEPYTGSKKTTLTGQSCRKRRQCTNYQEVAPWCDISKHDWAYCYKNCTQ